ncbi:MAG TPA: 2-C-methyl-D-erythritol 4-phosphate cytidylyltransferase, partial [Clostridia bacterium]|nr:2-C-methyl-D-erythritol 4-phosphate cytidylyltransferase [Clostridia bacterium]
CGLSALPGKTSQVIIHDGARPLLTPEDLMTVIEAGYRCGAATLAVPVKDTVKTADTGGWVGETLPREMLWLIQTPQVFEYGLITGAHQKARETGFTATDDASLVEEAGGKVKLVRGSYSNIKVTTPEDLLFAEFLVKRGGVYP